MSTTTIRSAQPIALVTGGSRGLGQSTALTLAQRGVDVILTYRSAEAEAGEVVRRIRDQGRKAVALRLDVGKSATFDAFAAEVRRQLEQLWARTSFDVLINNAGVGGYAPFAETSSVRGRRQTVWAQRTRTSAGS